MFKTLKFCLGLLVYVGEMGEYMAYLYPVSFQERAQVEYICYFDRKFGVKVFH